MPTQVSPVAVIKEIVCSWVLVYAACMSSNGERLLPQATLRATRTVVCSLAWQLASQHQTPRKLDFFRCEVAQIFCDHELVHQWRQDFARVPSVTQVLLEIECWHCSDYTGSRNPAYRMSFPSSGTRGSSGSACRMG